MVKRKPILFCGYGFLWRSHGANITWLWGGGQFSAVMWKFGRSFCQLLLQSQTPTPVNDLVIISPIRISAVTRAGLKGCLVTALSAGSFTFWAGLLILPKICVYIVLWEQMEGQFYFTSLSTLNFFAHDTTLSSSFLRNIKVAGWKHTKSYFTFFAAPPPTPARFLQRNYQLTEKNLAPVSLIFRDQHR